MYKIYATVTIVITLVAGVRCDCNKTENQNIIDFFAKFRQDHVFKDDKLIEYYSFAKTDDANLLKMSVDNELLSENIIINSANEIETIDGVIVYDLGSFRYEKIGNGFQFSFNPRNSEKIMFHVKAEDLGLINPDEILDPFNRILLDRLLSRRKAMYVFLNSIRDRFAGRIRRFDARYLRGTGSFGKVEFNAGDLDNSIIFSENELGKFYGICKYGGKQEELHVVDGKVL